MIDFINNIAGKNPLPEPKEGDYRDEEGILYCGICHKPLEKILNSERLGIKNKKVSCVCDCIEQEEKQFKERLKSEEKERYINKLRKNGITDTAYSKMTFKNSDGRNVKEIAFCKKYVENWKEAFNQGSGILFYGDIGTGKSYLACCIANALLAKGVPTLVTNISKLVKSQNDKSQVPVDLKNFDLLVLDDIGVENASATAYNIIDEWYKTGKPLIATTNLTPNELKQPQTREMKRIYSRIIHRCPETILVSNGITRLDMAKKQRTELEKVLGHI